MTSLPVWFSNYVSHGSRRYLVLELHLIVSAVCLHTRGSKWSLSMYTCFLMEIHGFYLSFDPGFVVHDLR